MSGTSSAFVTLSRGGMDSGILPLVLSAPISHTEIADTRRPSFLRASSSLLTLVDRTCSLVPSAHHSHISGSRSKALTCASWRAAGVISPAQWHTDDPHHRTTHSIPLVWALRRRL